MRRTLTARRTIVEAKLGSDASVAHVARQHGVNANQAFPWRKLYPQGLLDDEYPPPLLPVRIADRARSEARIELEFAEVQLSIGGTPDRGGMQAAWLSLFAAIACAVVGRCTGRLTSGNERGRRESRRHRE